MTVAFRRLMESCRFVGVSALLLVLALSGSALCNAALAQPAPRALPVPAPTAASSSNPAPATGEPPGYAQVMDEAVAEYDLHHFAEARALFARGLGMYPNARAYRGLGMTEFELRNYGDSVENLERALASTVKPLDGQLRTETQSLLERARGFVGKVNLAVEPGGATVLVDGTPVTIGPQGSLVIEVGDHVVEFRADGYRPETRNLKVRGGDPETLRIVLTKDAPARTIDLTTTAQPPGQDDRDGRRPLYKNPWLWAGIGVGVAALATGLAIGLSGDDAPGRSPRVGTIAGP